MNCEQCGGFENKAEVTQGKHAICDDCADKLYEAVVKLRQVVISHTRDVPVQPAFLVEANEALAHVPDPNRIEGESSQDSSQYPEDGESGQQNA